MITFLHENVFESLTAGVMNTQVGFSMLSILTVLSFIVLLTKLMASSFLRSNWRKRKFLFQMRATCRHLSVFTRRIHMHTADSSSLLSLCCLSTYSSLCFGFDGKVVKAQERENVPMTTFHYLHGGYSRSKLMQPLKFYVASSVR